MTYAVRLLASTVWLVALLFGAATGWAASATSPTPAARKKSPPILVLVSRSPNDPWAVSEVDGIVRGIRRAEKGFTPTVEYLDWQGGSGPEYEERLAAYYAVKFAGRDIKVVIAADDPAVNFLLHRRDSLFPKAQVVFCGVHQFDPAKRPPWLTGLLESNDTTGTFALARKLQPGLKRFLILEDNTGAGAFALRRLDTAFPDPPRGVSLELLRAETVQDLYSVVENLPADTAVLMTRARLARRVMEDLRERCPVPIYGLRAPMHLPGILGGSVLDGELHGEAAAAVAMRLLAGEKAAGVPFLTDGWHRLVVDYGQMQRFGLSFAALPPGAEVLNRPPSFWAENRQLVLIAGAIVLALAVLIVALARQLANNRKAVAQIDHSHSLLTATFDAIGEGVLVVDRTGKIAGHNEQFLQIWNIPPALAESKDDDALRKFVLAQLKEPEAFRQRVAELYAHPEECSHETIEFLSGRIVDRISRPQRQNGEIVGRVWSFRDITTERRAQEERERLASDLSQAQKMDALGTLAGGIAHDFNNMLTGILGCADLALGNLPLGHPARDDLKQVVHSAERAADLVRQILTFSRKRAPERKVLSFEPLIRETLKLLRATVPAGIELATEMQPDVPPVLAEPAQLQQTLLNLCTNAVHAMGMGPGELRITLERSAAPPEVRQANPYLPEGPLVCLTVHDTGHGIDPADLARIFDPFYTTKAPGEGTGLGLAVVHGIVRAHDGAIAAESTPGRGTTMALYFPPAEQPEEAAAAPEPPLRGHGEIVLVVDDEATVAEVAAAMLRRLGYHPVTCHGGEQAFELLRAEPGGCSLVLTDLNMPRISGLELIRRLRSAGNRVPCVVATGFIGSVGVEDEIRSLGVREILSKPFSPDSLGHAVSRALATEVAPSPSRPDVAKPAAAR